jgi:hypothetical protein
MPCRYIPAQLVSFAGCTPRSYHRKLHYLFLAYPALKKNPGKRGFF